ncbi:MAG: aminotransferase class IV family protein [Bacteroidetes bacterium]|nr:aminotransferase class IV family protein [Bacteroidota bacterium]
MSLLFETIRINEGLPQHLEWHEKRMKRSINELWGIDSDVNLAHRIVVPEDYSSGLVKCNITYGPEIGQIVFSCYEKRIIRSLKLVECDTIDYHMKYCDRTVLDELFRLRDECDDILIIKNGYVTDTSFSNIIFGEGDKWITPAKPLLKGTCRERLISQGFLEERNITAKDIPGFDGWKLINAMRDPEEEEMKIFHHLNKFL